MVFVGVKTEKRLVTYDQGSLIFKGYNIHELIISESFAFENGKWGVKSLIFQAIL